MTELLQVWLGVCYVGQVLHLDYYWFGSACFKKVVQFKFLCRPLHKNLRSALSKPCGAWMIYAIVDLSYPTCSVDPRICASILVTAENATLIPRSPKDLFVVPITQNSEIGVYPCNHSSSRWTEYDVFDVTVHRLPILKGFTLHSQHFRVYGTYGTICSDPLILLAVWPLDLEMYSLLTLPWLYVFDLLQITQSSSGTFVASRVN